VKSVVCDTVAYDELATGQLYGMVWLFIGNRFSYTPEGCKAELA